ncbi:hypothetical protein LCGC14_0900970 [marine sediment metagenome]|uniref:Uncharacterized protein n=1 Tax=marine sediment metagenome TaxID=412755 RepID=A0A0F9NWH2_9ZZZZ
MGLPIINKINHPASRTPAIFTPHSIQDLINFNLNRLLKAGSGIGDTSNFVTGSGTVGRIPAWTSDTTIGNSAITQTGGDLVFDIPINMDGVGFPQAIHGIDRLQFKDNIDNGFGNAYAVLRVGNHASASLEYQYRNTAGGQWNTYMKATSGVSPTFQILLGDISASTTYNGAAWAASFLSATAHYNVNYSKKYNSNTADITAWDGSSAFAAVHFGTAFELMIHHGTHGTDQTYMDFFDPVTWRYNAGGSAPYYDGAKTNKIEISENEIDFVNGMIPKVNGASLLNTAAADTRYVEIAGDTMTGALFLSSLATVSNNIIDFTGNSTNNRRGISFNSRSALSADFNDGFLRINDEEAFTNGVFTPHKIRADQGLFIDGGGRGIKAVTGSYGNVQTTGAGVNSYRGYNINGDAIFMSNSTHYGLYDDTNNEWGLLCTRNGASNLYFNGVPKLATVTGGVEVTGELSATGDVIAYKT